MAAVFPTILRETFCPVERGAPLTAFWAATSTAIAPPAFSTPSRLTSSVGPPNDPLPDTPAILPASQSKPSNRIRWGRRSDDGGQEDCVDSVSEYLGQDGTCGANFRKNGGRKARGMALGSGRTQDGYRHRTNRCRGNWVPPAAIAISKIVMEKTAKEQIRSGLRVGTGLGGFLIAVMLIGNGLARIGISTASHQLIWTEPVGWMELLIAALILLFTARMWLMLLSGCLLFGIVKSLVVFATGRFPSHEFSTRIEPLALAFYCIASFVLMFRFSEHQPNLIDRIALTLYVFCLWPAIAGSIFSPWQIVGLGALLISWCLSRWRKDSRRSRTWSTHNSAS